MSKIPLLVALLALTSWVGPARAHEPDQRRASMISASLERNKELVRRVYEECINEGHMDRLPALVADDYLGASGERGPAGFAATLDTVRNAFPDIRFTLEDVVAEGDRVVVRWTWKGTHERAFRELAASHKRLDNNGIAIYQVKAGKLAQAWLLTDRLGLLQQMGVVPATLGGPPARK